MHYSKLRIMHLSFSFLVSFLALFQHLVRLPSQCSKTAVSPVISTASLVAYVLRLYIYATGYVIKIPCRVGKFRDVAHQEFDIDYARCLRQ